MTRQTRNACAAAFGLTGFLCAGAMILWGSTSDLKWVQSTELHMLAVSGPSAAVAGWLCAGLFGRPNGFGWFCAGNGALLSTVLGAAIAAALIAPLLGVVFEPLVVFWTFGAFPVVGLVWLASMCCLHYFVFKSVR